MRMLATFTLFACYCAAQLYTAPSCDHTPLFATVPGQAPLAPPRQPLPAPESPAIPDWTNDPYRSIASRPQGDGYWVSTARGKVGNIASYL